MDNTRPVPTQPHDRYGSRNPDSTETRTMRCSSLLRLPLLMALAAVATVGSLATASAAVARVTCSSIVGVGNAKHPAAVTGCTDPAKTGAMGTLVARWPGSGSTGIWTFAWAGGHGTSIVRVTERAQKKHNTCPKGWLPFVAAGKVIGGTGTAHAVIANGQTVSAHGCGNAKTGVGRLAKGTKLVL